MEPHPVERGEVDTPNLHAMAVGIPGTVGESGGAEELAVLKTPKDEIEKADTAGDPCGGQRHPQPPRGLLRLLNLFLFSRFPVFGHVQENVRSRQGISRTRIESCS